MKYRDTAAGLIRRGKNVALYCDGIFSDTNLAYLDKFFGARPAVVIDNDPRKKGKTLFGIPVLPYAEARDAFPDLYYYVQGNTYLYTIIGELLEDGVAPEHMINYRPVERREGCLIAESAVGFFGSDCTLCYETGANYNKNNRPLPLLPPESPDDFRSRFLRFRREEAFLQQDGSDCRAGCPVNKPGFYASEPKIRLIGDYIPHRCMMKCIYCFYPDMDYIQEVLKNGTNRIPFHQFLSILLRAGLLDDAAVLHLCPAERVHDEDLDETMRLCLENIDAFEAIHLFSCCYAYRAALEPLLAKGMAKVYWSLDAGTEETYEKIKRVPNAFSRVLENMSGYRDCDAFGGLSIVPKYAVVKGVNDNERDFDGFVDLCLKFHARYCAIQWDYADNDNTSAADYAMIRDFYGKIRSAGLKLTYSAGSTVLARALDILPFYENRGDRK